MLRAYEAQHQARIIVSSFYLQDSKVLILGRWNGISVFQPTIKEVVRFTGTDMFSLTHLKPPTSFFIKNKTILQKTWCYFLAARAVPHRYFIVITISCINACSSPSVNFHKIATQKLFNRSFVAPSLFQHTIYSNKPTILPSKEILHVYLDGDGTPWLHNRWIAKDPTARDTTILKLMEMDKQAAILLGRPCYYGSYTNQACHPRFWTSHRYAPEIVNSMKEALYLWLAQHPYFQQITFIGYSGGGTLAVLLAPHFKQTRQVITIAANLDIESWTKLHGYTPLTGSLNPLQEKKLPPSIRQLHIAGEQDHNVPISIIKSYAIQQDSAEVLVFEKQSHCCWDKHWLSILDIIETHEK